MQLSQFDFRSNQIVKKTFVRFVFYRIRERKYSVEIFEFPKRIFLIHSFFHNKYILTRQMGDTLDITDQVDDTISSGQYPYVELPLGCKPPRYVRKRIYTAFPEIHACTILEAGGVNELVQNFFDLESLLTLSDSTLRARAKEYYERRHS